MIRADDQGAAAYVRRERYNRIEIFISLIVVAVLRHLVKLGFVIKAELDKSLDMFNRVRIGAGQDIVFKVGVRAANNVVARIDHQYRAAGEHFFCDIKKRLISLLQKHRMLQSGPIIIHG